MKAFFRSVAKLIRYKCVPNTVEIRLFMQGDQFSRWHCLNAADEAMFDLRGWMWDVDLATIPNYKPSRNDSADAFPVRKPVLLSFRGRPDSVSGKLEPVHVHDNISGDPPLKRPRLYMHNASRIVPR